MKKSNKGWKGEPARHSLAARGISTAKPKTTLSQREEAFWKERTKTVPTDEEYQDHETQERVVNVAEMWERGESGKRDHRHRHKRVIALNKENYTYWKDHKTELDIEGIDVPRKDMREIKVAGKSFYIGGNTKSELDYTEFIMKKAMKHFTNKEIQNMENLYIQLSDKFDEHRYHKFATQTNYEVKNTKGSSIIVNQKHPYDRLEQSLVHELVHALRHGEGRQDNNIANEERKTELETLSRVGIDTYVKNLGYYGFIGEDALVYDKAILADGNLNQELKGKKATDAVKKHYKNSKIKDMEW